MEDNWIRVNVVTVILVGYQARLISGNGIFGNPMGEGRREEGGSTLGEKPETTLIPKHP